MSETDTPETDATWLQCCEDEERLYALKQLCEKMERERDEFQRQLQSTTELLLWSRIERDEARREAEHYRNRCYEEPYRPLPWEKRDTER